MVDPREPDRGDVNRSSSYFQKTVMLRDWWLVKSHEEFEGKRFGVAGTELMASIEQRAVRVFTSAPIVKAFDVFTLETSDGICILLKGFINKERTVKNGFSPEIFRHFVFGFPPCWDEISKKCFEEGSSCGTGVHSMSLRIDKDLADHTVLTPCKNKESKVEDEHMMEAKRVTTCEPVRSQNELQPSSLLKAKNKYNIDDVNDKESCNKQHPVSKGKKTTMHSTKQAVSSESVKVKPNTVRKSLRLQSKDIGKGTDIERTSTGSRIKVSSHAYDGDNCNSMPMLATEKNSDGLNEARSVDAEKDDSNVIKDDLLSPEVDIGMSGEHSATQLGGFSKRRAGPVSKDRIRRKNATQESVRLEQSKIKRIEIRASPSLVSKYCEKNTETGLKVSSSKGANFANVKGLYHSGTTPEEDESCVQEEYPMGEKTKRKINFDLEVTPRKQVRKEDTGVVSPESSSFKRSRSGRLLVSTLEFWRNQVPVYDADRKIIGIKEGGINTKTPASKAGSGSKTRRRGRR